jgi:hypothetical protein
MLALVDSWLGLARKICGIAAWEILHVSDSEE